MFKHYYAVDDAITYFTNRVEGTVNADYMKKLCSNHPLIEGKLGQILTPSVELERLLNKAFPLPDPNCELYFGLDRSLSGEKQPLSNAAWLLMGYRAGTGLGEGDLDSIISSRLEMPRDERDKLFISYVYDLEATDVLERTKNGADVETAIMESGINLLVRMKLSELYKNFENHIVQLGEILRPAVEIIEKNEGVYAEAVGAMGTLVDSYPDLSAYMEDKHSFKLNEEGRHVAHLCVLAPHTVNIRDGVFKSMDVYLGVGVNELAELLYSGRENERLAAVFKILSDETRLEILRMISSRPMYGLEIAEAFNITAPTVSYHMTKLVMSGLAESYFEGGRSYYRANEKNISALGKVFEGFFKK